MACREAVSTLPGDAGAGPADTGERHVGGRLLAGGVLAAGSRVRRVSCALAASQGCDAGGTRGQPEPTSGHCFTVRLPGGMLPGRTARLRGEGCERPCVRDAPGLPLELLAHAPTPKGKGHIWQRAPGPRKEKAGCSHCRLASLILAAFPSSAFPLGESEFRCPAVTQPRGCSVLSRDTPKPTCWH